MRLKKCKGCGEKFAPSRPLQSVCNPSCALVRARKKTLDDAAKRQRAKTKAARESLKTRSDHLKEAQTEFNKYIRLRDKDLPCVSCGRHHEGQYHAGHYRSVGAAPHLRFNEDNVWKQCSVCNNHLSGNQIEYRISLTDRIGLNKVEAIEHSNDPAKLSIEEIKAIKLKYRAMAKELASL